MRYRIQRKIFWFLVLFTPLVVWAKEPLMNDDAASAYVKAWADLTHSDLLRFHKDAGNFFGTIGTLDFQFTGDEGVLHAWIFIMPGADPLSERGKILKATLDRIAREDPGQTDGAVFDIRSLAWNKQASPSLEPCLWLRLDLKDARLSSKEMALRLQKFSHTGYQWHREKIQAVLRDYWQKHPRAISKRK